MQSPQDEKVALKEIHDTLRQCYELINSAFIFYPTGTSADVFHMGLNQFTALLEDCKVPFLQATQYCGRSFAILFYRGSSTAPGHQTCWDPFSSVIQDWSTCVLCGPAFKL